MTEKEEIIRLLEEKKELLLQFEQISDGMYRIPMEELQHSIGKRQALVNKMQKLDERIELLCSGLEPMVCEAVYNRCNRGDVDEELGTIFDKALETKAVARRVLKNQDGIRQRIEIEQIRTREQIQKLNASSSVVAGRYGQAVRTGKNSGAIRKSRETKV